MKIAFLAALCALLISAPAVFAQYKNPAAAADAEMEREKLLRAADTIEDLRKQLDAMRIELDTLRGDMDEMKKENESLRATHKQLAADNQKLAEAITQVDKARDTDRKEIVAAIEEAAQKSKGPAPAAKREPAATPDPAAEKPRKDSSKKPKPKKEGQFYEHAVEKGHTLSAIAKAYGVTVEEIRTANDLKGNNLKIGQKLLIPKKD
ncbi:MAG: LysM peptidoglycan-binding domain-containing protein [Verrucomicrobiae bacterium]|nr:LysM peptidoglycan-binding domain-containing protein [Verrucomicrobiae bacterium]